MDHSGLVRRFEGFGDLRGDGERFIERDAAVFLRACCNQVRQRRTLDELQHQRSHPRRLFQPVDAADVGMVQRGQHFGFALEACEPVGVGGERLGQHLQRHVPVELGVAGLIHLAHAAFADLGGNLIHAEPGAGGECHGESVDYIGGEVVTVHMATVASVPITLRTVMLNSLSP